MKYVARENSGGLRSNELTVSELKDLGDSLYPLENSDEIKAKMSEYLLDYFYPGTNVELVSSVPLKKDIPGSYRENTYLVDGKEVKLDLSTRGKTQHKVQLILEDGSRITAKHNSYVGFVALDTILNLNEDDDGKTVYDSSGTTVDKNGRATTENGIATIEANGGTSTRVNFLGEKPDFYRFEPRECPAQLLAIMAG